MGTHSAFAIVVDARVGQARHTQKFPKEHTRRSGTPVAAADLDAGSSQSDCSSMRHCVAACTPKLKPAQNRFRSALNTSNAAASPPTIGALTNRLNECEQMRRRISRGF